MNSVKNQSKHKPEAVNPAITAITKVSITTMSVQPEPKSSACYRSNPHIAYFLSLGLFLCLWLMPGSALAQTTNNDIVGEWKIDYPASYATIDSTTLKSMSEYSTAHKDQIKNNYESMVYTFTQGGTFTVTLGANSVSGTWGLTSVDNKLTLDYSTGTSMEFTVVNAQTGSLHIKLINSLDDSIILKEMFLIKQ